MVTIVLCVAPARYIFLAIELGFLFNSFTNLMEFDCQSELDRGYDWANFMRYDSCERRGALIRD